MMDAARRPTARDGETWPETVRRTAPPMPPLWRPIDRSDWQKALAEASRRGTTTRETAALAFPLWLGANEDEVPADDVWSARLLVVAGDDVLLDPELDDRPPFWARLQLVVTRGAMLVPRRHYAPGIPLEAFGPFAVLDADVATRITMVDACALAPAAPRPDRVVPAFSTIALPAFDVDQVPDDVAAAVQAAVRRLTAIAADDGEA